MTFVPDRGWSGDGLSGYLGLAATYDSFPNVTQNSVHIGAVVYGGTDVSANVYVLGSDASGTSVIELRPRGSTGAIDAHLCSTTGSAFGATSTILGHTIVTRTSSTAMSGYRNGVVNGTDSDVSTGTSTGNVCVLRSGTVYADFAVSLVHWGGALSDADAETLYEIAARYEMNVSGQTTRTYSPYIDVSTQMSSFNDTKNAFADVQAILQANPSTKLVFKNNRAWRFTDITDGAVSLGPSFDIEFEPGTVWDFSSRISTGDAQHVTALGAYSTVKGNVAGDLAAGDPTITVTTGQGANFVPFQQYLLYATTGLMNSVGAFTLVDSGVAQSVSISGAVVTCPNTFSAGDPVIFSAGTLPTPLIMGVAYYVSSTGLSTSNFQVSATPGGSPITTSGSSSGVTIQQGPPKGEWITVLSVTGDVLTLFGQLAQSYPATSSAVLVGVDIEPTGYIRGMSILGANGKSVANNTGERALTIKLGRNLKLEDIFVSNVSQGINLQACRNSRLLRPRGILPNSDVNSFLLGTGVGILTGSDDVIVEDGDFHGGHEVYLFTGATTLFGQITNCGFVRCSTKGGYASGFATHSNQYNCFIKDCRVEDAELGIDARIAGMTIDNVQFKNLNVTNTSKGAAIFLRANATHLSVRNCKSENGNYFLTFDQVGTGAPYIDSWAAVPGMVNDVVTGTEVMVPSAIVIQNNAIYNAALGGIDAQHFFTYGNSVTSYQKLGSLLIQDNYIQTFPSGSPFGIRVGGPWTGARVTGNTLDGGGGTSAGYAVTFTTAPSNNISAITTGNPTTFSVSNHNFVPNLPVFFTGTLPSGLSANTLYYVMTSGLTGSTFQVSASPSGASSVTTSGTYISGASVTYGTTIGAQNPIVTNNTWGTGYKAPANYSGVINRTTAYNRQLGNNIPYNTFYINTPMPHTLTGEDSDTVLSNFAAAAGAPYTIFTLPGSGMDGGVYRFMCETANGIQIKAASGDTITIAAGTTAGGGSIKSITPSSYVELRSVTSSIWLAVVEVGTWTIGTLP